jgi:hypothetical protein
MGGNYVISIASLDLAALTDGENRQRVKAMDEERRGL